MNDSEQYLDNLIHAVDIFNDLPEISDRTRYMHNKNIELLLKAGFSEDDLLYKDVDEMIKRLYARRYIYGKSRTYSVRNTLRIYREVLL